MFEDLYFPPQAAVVMLQQRSYANQILNDYFDQPPQTKSEVMRNKEFIRALRDHMKTVLMRYGPTLLDFLGEEKGIRKILDIGCGMAWFDLSIYMFMKTKPDLFLVDGYPHPVQDDVLRIAERGYHENYEFSADIGATHELLAANGVSHENINFIAPSPAAIANLKEIDLVVSLTSWFWHYPGQKYWKAVASVLHGESRLYVDVARGRPADLAFLKNHFVSVETVNEFENGNRLRVLASQPTWLGKNQKRSFIRQLFD